MVEVNCPVCGLDFEVPEGKGVGDIVVCPFCGAELKLVIKDGQLAAEEV